MSASWAGVRRASSLAVRQAAKRSVRSSNVVPTESRTVLMARYVVMAPKGAGRAVSIMAMA